jgi:hypothetical protein
MSQFSDAWVKCMHGNGLPVPEIQELNEALEFVDKIHSAFENATGKEEITIGALLAVGAFVGFDEAALAALTQAAAITATAYLAACVGCLASVALDDLKDLFASGDLSAFVVAQLESDGINISDHATA